jgi:hypothetical protein
LDGGAGGAVGLNLSVRPSDAMSIKRLAELAHVPLQRFEQIGGCGAQPRICLVVLHEGFEGADRELGVGRSDS